MENFTNEDAKVLDDIALSLPKISSQDLETLANETSDEDFKIHRHCRFFRLEELLYDGEKPTREAWQNFISAIHVTGMNFVYVIRGDSKGTHIYLGLSAKPGTPDAEHIGDYAYDIIESSFQGMFRGSRLVSLREDQIETEIFDPIKNNRYVNLVTGVPSLQDEKKNPDSDYQGMDRLISAMHGENWQMIIVCEPLKREDVTDLREKVYSIYDTLSILAKSSLQSSHSTSKGKTHGTNSSQSQTVGTSDSVGKTNTQGTSTGQSKSENVSVNHTTNSGENISVSHTSGKSSGRSETFGENKSHQESHGKSSGESKSKSANEGYTNTDSYNDGSESRNRGTSKSSSQQSGSSHSTSTSAGSSRSRSTTTNTSDSETQGKTRNTGTSDSQSKGRSEQTSSGKNQSTSQSNSHSSSQSFTTSTGENTGLTDTDGRSLTASVDVVNKRAAEFLKYIDETLLPRLSVGNNRGMFKTAVYLMTETKSINTRLCNNVAAIFQGKSSAAFTPLITTAPISRGNWMGDLQIHSPARTKELPYGVLYGMSSQHQELSTCLTGDEVGIIAGLPLTEVPGVALRRYVPFGLNPELAQNKKFVNPLNLGALVYGGKMLSENKVALDKNVLNKHIFVTGITGSGKTVTCKKLLSAAGMNFLVIEPAKTEYKELVLQEGMKDVIVFTLGTEDGLPLRFNPFEMLPGENLTAHIDLIKAAFMSSFHFEASMPQIFEMAMYRVYKECGWDTDSGEYEGTDEKKWPTLTSFIKKLEEVVKEQKFGPELEGNYRGSLISRIANLTYGAKGKMLNCEKSVNFINLLRSKVVIEMEDLKSPQDKALIMALIMGRLNEAVKQIFRHDHDFRHITLIEEAHRLLSKVMPGDEEGKKYSVSMFTDMLAEIRKYGESLIIVDQIPNKLAEDVLKNTATKIVHKLVAKDDKEVIGDTMMLEDEQKIFLSNLMTGRAIVFTEDWHKPVCVQIEELHTKDIEILDECLIDMERKTKWKNLDAYYPELPTTITWQEYCNYLDNGRKSLKLWKKLIGQWTKLTAQEKISLYEKLPKDFCKSIDDAKIIFKALLHNNSGVPKMTSDDIELYSSAVLFAAVEPNFETFEKKFSGDMRLLSGYL